MARKASTQIKLPGTLPTLKHARRAWETALAELEEIETKLEAHHDEGTTLREYHTEAAKAFRIACAVRREVEATMDSQVKIDE